MKLKKLIIWAKDKTRFKKIDDYANFCEEYLEFIYN